MLCTLGSCAGVHPFVCFNVLNNTNTNPCVFCARYASSGINAAPPAGVVAAEVAPGDSADLYHNDTVRSSGRDMAALAGDEGGGDDLMSVLARNSYRALTWFRTRVRVPCSTG